MANIGNLNVKLTATAGGLLGTLARSSAGVRAFATNVHASTARLTAFSARILTATGALTALVGGAGMVALVKRSMESIDAMVKVADRLGITTERLIAYRHAADLAGVGNQAFDKALEQMLRRLGEAQQGLGQARNGLEALNLPLEHLRGMDAGEQFREIAERISKIEDPAKKAATAYQLFGRQGQQLLNLINTGAAGLDAAVAEAERLGITVSRIDGASIEEANDQVSRLRSAVGGAANTFAIALAPSIKKAADRLTEMASAASTRQAVAAAAAKTVEFAKGALRAGQAAAKFVSDNRQMIATTLKVVAGLTAAGMILPKVIGGVKLLTAAVIGLKTASIFLAANPFVALAAAAAAAVIATTAFANMGKVVAELRDQAAEHLAAADRMRANDLLRVESLRHLASQQKLNAQQMADATQDIEELRSRYGELGIELDKTTGRLTANAEGWEKLRREMRLTALQEVANQIREVQANLDQLAIEREFTPSFAFDGRDFAEEAARNLAETQAAGEKLLSLRRRLKELEDLSSPASASAVTGGAEAAEAALRRQQALMGEFEQAEKVRTAIEAIEQQAARLGMTDLQIKLADLRELGATQEELASIEQTLRRIRQHEADADATVEMRTHLERIQQELDTLKLDPLTIELKPLMDLRMQAGISDGVRQMLDDQIARYQKLAEERNRLRADAEDRDDAQQIIERNRTLAERAARELELARHLFAKGTPGFGEEQFVRELERIKASLAEDDREKTPEGPSDRRPTLMEATASNIAQAFDTLQRVQRGDAGKSVDEKQLKVEQDQKKVLDKIEGHLRNPPAPQVVSI